MFGPFTPALVLVGLLATPASLQALQARNRGAKCSNPKVRSEDHYSIIDSFCAWKPTRKGPFRAWKPPIPYDINQRGESKIPLPSSWYFDFHLQ